MIDVSRHNEVFNPVQFGSRRVDVVGVGAIGSKVALSIAKLGVKSLHVWDHDVIERHNLANQAYLEGQVGQSKATAIGNLIIASGGATPIEHAQKWDGETLGEVVFCAVDSMAARRQLFDSPKVRLKARLVVDTRLGAHSAQIFSYDPSDLESRAAYEATLFSDEEADTPVSACGTQITVGPTGDVVVGFAVWQFINYAAGEAVESGIHLDARMFSSMTDSQIAAL